LTLLKNLKLDFWRKEKEVVESNEKNKKFDYDIKELEDKARKEREKEVLRNLIKNLAMIENKNKED